MAEGQDGVNFAEAGAEEETTHRGVNGQEQHPVQPRPVPGIRPPQPVCYECTPAENWKIFKQKWGNYALITNLAAQAREYQVALLLHTLGEEALKAYNGFQFSTPASQRTVDEVLEQFDKFAIGEINETYERYLFNKRDQKESESFEYFHASIRSLVKTCNYCDSCVSSIIRDRIVLGIHDSSTQQALLKERNLTLVTCIDVCKAAENAATQCKTLRPETVNKVTAPKQKATRPLRMAQQPQEKICKFCRLSHVFVKSACPAWGKTCNVCKQRNHFAKKCPNSKQPRAREVHRVAEDESSESDGQEWLNSVRSPKPYKEIKCLMSIGKHKVVFQVDTGASVNILPARFAPSVTPTTKKLKIWNGNEYSPLGTCRTTVRNPKGGKKYSVEFTVVKEDLTPLLGLKTAEQMKLIVVNEEQVERVAVVAITDRHAALFDETLGTFHGRSHLNVDNTVIPVVMPARRVPLAIRPRLKTELERLTEIGVITPVDEPTPWVSQLVIAEKKSGKLRICLDPRELNKALKREHYTLPILDDMLHELSQSRVFSKADLAQGYWHVQLDTESSMLTTFQTCFGRYRWLRLPFGTSVSSEIFQKRLIDALGGLTGVACIADDVIIHAATVEEHDQVLDAFLARCREKGIKLNSDKFQLLMEELTFMGHRISKDGLQVDDEKVRAVMAMKPPTNMDGLRRFLGLVNYMAKFLPNLTEVVQPLRNLMKKDVPWTWSATQDQAFLRVKEMVSNTPVLAFYDPTKDLVLENDASEYGVGSVLLQDGRPVAFASRSLTDTETRYAQIEKEMLAVAFGLEKFHYYTYGRKVTIVTDHKPLVAIVSKPLSKAPRRLQSLLLRTQKYVFGLVYKPGTSIPVADALSRNPLPDKPVTDVVTVNNVSFSPIRRGRLEEIRVASEKDQTFTELKSTIMKGWPDDKSRLPPTITPFFNYRDELSVQDGIILRGERVVIPRSMRADIKRKVHAGHMGINSCLRRARELVFWPGMSADIRQHVEACNVCATYSDRQGPETLFMHEVPGRPWEKVGSDLLSFEGRTYIVTVDYYSKFFEIDYLIDTGSAAVIDKLKHHFARHGIPDTVITDGGPQYNSEKFRTFSTKWGFTHEMTSPGNSKANGVAEAAVKSAKKLMRKCKASREDPYLGLLNLRNTPTESLQTSPAQRLVGRRTKTMLPTTLDRLRPTNQDAEVTKMDDKRATLAQRKNEFRHDLPPLRVGDTVRMQPIQTGLKEWKPATVTKQIKSRTYEVTASNGRTYKRNRQFLRVSRANDALGNEKVTHVPTVVGKTTTGELVVPTTSKEPADVTTQGASEGVKGATIGDM
ncbi:PREDICTED: uncharacterized protein K02A2.6-like, partial [Priapulus caudatus]|uniref:RNA-directed DNA polymerase n=1 Tax=Priapulus caudatus TaxID=37621 RepID=A0ABM1DYV5_PRICU